MFFQCNNSSRFSFRLVKPQVLSDVVFVQICLKEWALNPVQKCLVTSTVGCDFVVNCLSCFEIGLLFLCSLWAVCQEEMLVLSKAFSPSSETILQFMWWVTFIYQFMRVEPSLHLWSEGSLTMADSLFDVVFYLVFKYFVENFCICVAYNFIFLLGLIRYYGNNGFIKRIGKCSFSFYFAE